MADNQTARITIGLPKEVTKALRMKAINDEITSAEIIINALALAYSDDELLSKPLEDAMANAQNDESNEQSGSMNDHGYHEN